MEFARVNPGDPERIYMVVRNSYSTASLTSGQWCGWDIVTDKDGFSVTKISGAIRSAPAGVAVETIPHLQYGLIQVWGYLASARCLGGSGSITSKITAGQALKFYTSGFAARAFARNSAQLKSAHWAFPCGIGIEPLNTAAIATFFATSGQYKILIRCL